MAHDYNNPMTCMLEAMLAPQRTMMAASLDFWTRACGLGREMVDVTSRDMVPYKQGRDHEQQEQQTIGVGEEWLDVSTRRVYGPTTRVRRVVHTSPVERRVDLRDETIIVERYQANGEAGDDGLIERDYVMSDSIEVPVVNKRTRLREVVVLRKQAQKRAEMVRDTVRRADVHVEQPQRVPVVVERDEKREHKPMSFAETVPQADRQAHANIARHQGEVGAQVINEKVADAAHSDD